MQKWFTVDVRNPDSPGVQKTDARLRPFYQFNRRKNFYCQKGLD